MFNPDPKRYIIKKLRNREPILIDKQVIRWRSRKQPYTSTSRKLGRPKKGQEKPKGIDIINFFDND